MSESYTYEKTSISDLMPEGDYEVILERMERRTLSNGKDKLWIMYRVRSGVEGQSYGNKCLFEDIWPEKENPKYFNRKRINQLLGTQDTKEGTEFPTINDVINFMVGASLIVHVKKEFDDYRGEEINKIGYYKSSKLKPKTIVSEDKKQDEDLGFDPSILDDLV